MTTRLLEAKPAPPAPPPWTFKTVDIANSGVDGLYASVVFRRPVPKPSFEPSPASAEVREAVARMVSDFLEAHGQKLNELQSRLAEAQAEKAGLATECQRLDQLLQDALSRGEPLGDIEARLAGQEGSAASIDRRLKHLASMLIAERAGLAASARQHFEIGFRRLRAGYEEQAFAAAVKLEEALAGLLDAALHLREKADLLSQPGGQDLWLPREGHELLRAPTPEAQHG
jgi:hypothetical protein